MGELETFNVHFALSDGTTTLTQVTGTGASIQDNIMRYILDNDIDAVDFDYEYA